MAEGGRSAIRDPQQVIKKRTQYFESGHLGTDFMNLLAHGYVVWFCSENMASRV